MDDNLNALTTLFTEFYYWVTVVIMFLIHVGFCMYEVGVSRRRNHLHTLMKNTMVIPVGHHHLLPLRLVDLLGVAERPVHLRGQGPHPRWRAPGANQYAPCGARRWGVNLQDHITGVFWAAFLLFSWTVASIVSGSLDRARQVGRLLAHRRDDRIGDLDHRCGLGLALRRLDGEAARLSRRLCVWRRSMPSPAAPRSAC